MREVKRNKCFIDTSALIALNHVKDQYHYKARDISTKLKNYDFMISEAVITETYSLLRYRLGFYIAHYFLKTVLTGPPFIIPNVTTSTREKTLQILQQFNDQDISYCDALTVALMKEHNIEKVFAFDYHFEVMGVKLIRI